MAHRNQKGNHWLYIGLILIAALALRVYLAVTMPWRQDEIVYVDWLGQWFADHLVAYLTQWHHTFYPPQSPVFANPPLGMWLLSIGIAIGRFFDIPLLLAARSVSILLGMGTLVTLYCFCRRFFSERTAQLSLIAMAFLPIVASNHASAFLDTTLGLLLLLATWQFFDIIQSRTVETNQILRFSLLIGLALLTKFSIVFILAVIGLTVLIKLAKAKQHSHSALLIIATVLIPPIIWSGLRDVNHINGIITFFTSKYALIYAWPGQPISYLLYLIHDIPTVLLILSVVAIVYSKTKKNEGLIIWLLLFVVFGLLNLQIFAPTSYNYQLLPIIPFLIVVASWTLDQLFTGNQKKLLAAQICVVLLSCELLYITIGQPVAFYTLSQTVLSQAIHINSLVPPGTGSEDLPLIAQYIQENLPANARIAAIYNDWTLRKYLSPTQSVTSLFPNETIEAAATRGAGYIVASSYFLPKSSQAARALAGLKPLKSLVHRDTILAQIYAVPRQTQTITSIPLDTKWQQSLENTRLIEFTTSSNSLSAQLEFDYDTNNPVRYASLTIDPPITMPSNTTGIAMQLYGEGRSKNIYLDLLDPQTGNYRRALIPLDWNGWQTVEIPLRLFKDIQIGTSPKSVDFSKPISLRISVDSPDSHVVTFKLSDLEFVKQASHENSLR